MMPMIPGSWYRTPQQNPGLTLAQAANPVLQTIPQYPQPLPLQTIPQYPQMQTLPAMPQPAPPKFLGSSIPMPGLDKTLPSMPQPAPGAEFSYYDDDSLMDAYHWETNPEKKQRMMMELTRRGTGPDKWSELTPIDQRPQDPGYVDLQTRERDAASPGPKGNYGPAWDVPPPVLPSDVERPAYETQKGQTPDPQFDALLQGLLGQLGADSTASTGASSVPGLPARPASSATPDFGPFPEAPVLAGPDFSQANEYFQAAKPKPYEKSQEEMGLAVLAGALGGFDPHGSVGEILGRMAGPGIQGGFGQYKEDKAQSRAYDRDLAAWNAAMGQQASSQAATSAQVANQNAQLGYETALAKYQDAQNRFHMAREEDRWQASYDLQRAGAELQRAQLEMQQGLINARIGYYNRGGAGGHGAGGLSMGSILKTIADGVNQGALPGIEGMNEQMAATRQAILSEAQSDPNRLALFMSDPSQLDMEVRRRLTEQIFQIAQSDPNLMMQLILAGAKGKTGLGLEDVLSGLSGE